MEYTFIRSKRKTIGITVERDGSIILRAPLYCSKRRAEAFLYEKRDWIERTRRKVMEQKPMEPVVSFTADEIKALKKRAGIIVPPMVSAVVEEMGVSYGRISIRAQKSRWGSCTSEGNLNFNCLLVLLPERVMRYIVVHELCHLRELNHSKRFWAEVAKYQPTYKEDRKYLKEEGDELIRRIP